MHAFLPPLLPPLTKHIHACMYTHMHAQPKNLKRSSLSKLFSVICLAYSLPDLLHSSLCPEHPSFSSLASLISIDHNLIVLLGIPSWIGLEMQFLASKYPPHLSPIRADGQTQWIVLFNCLPWGLFIVSFHGAWTTLSVLFSMEAPEPSTMRGT